MYSQTNALQGLLVLELANVLAGPGAGQFLAELGATVIKIENITTCGDVTRSWRLPSEPTNNDISAYFSTVNWGKQSVALNLKKQEGRQIVHNLAALADVVLVSYKPGDAEKLEVDYHTLQALNPRLIYAEITGYSSQTSRAGYDAVIQAESGFMYLNGQPDGPPTKMPVALVDVLASHQLREGILLALYKRTISGVGARVSVSLIDAAVSSLANQASNYLVAGVNPERIGSEHPNIAPYGSIFTTADQQQLVLAIGDDKQFAALCEILNITDAILSGLYNTNSLRLQHKKELLELLQQAIGGQELPDLLPKLIKANVPAGHIKDVKTVFDDPEQQQRLLTNSEVEYKGVPSVAFSFKSESGAPPLSPPPHFGEHTELVLEQYLHFNSTHIEQLKQAQVL